MTKDEVIAWFDTTENISPILASMRMPVNRSHRHPAHL
jgi:hypothetical protein